MQAGEEGIVCIAVLLCADVVSFCFTFLKEVVIKSLHAIAILIQHIFFFQFTARIRFP